MVQRGEGAALPPPVGGEGEDPPTALQLRIQGLNLKDTAEVPQCPLEAAPPEPPQELPELMIAHRTDRSLIVLSPHRRDPPCVLTLRSSVQGSIGLQRSGSPPHPHGLDPIMAMDCWPSNCPRGGWTPNPIAPAFTWLRCSAACGRRWQSVRGC